MNPSARGPAIAVSSDLCFGRSCLLPLPGRSLRSAASLRRHYLAPPLLSVGLALKLGRRLDQLGQIRAPTDQERLGHRPMRHIPALEAT
jgi:hypothetical protein